MPEVIYLPSDSETMRNSTDVEERTRWWPKLGAGHGKNPESGERVFPPLLYPNQTQGSFISSYV